MPTAGFPPETLHSTRDGAREAGVLDNTEEEKYKSQMFRCL